MVNGNTEGLKEYILNKLDGLYEIKGKGKLIGMKKFRFYCRFE